MEEAFAIQTLGDGNATVAWAVVDGHLYVATSKRDPRDKHDPEIGAELAVSRLLVRVARRMERRVNGKVRHADQVKADRLHAEALRIESQMQADARQRQLLHLSMAPVEETLDPIDTFTPGVKLQSQLKGRGRHERP